MYKQMENNQFKPKKKSKIHRYGNKNPESIDAKKSEKETEKSKSIDAKIGKNSKDS